MREQPDYTFSPSFTPPGQPSPMPCAGSRPPEYRSRVPAITASARLFTCAIPMEMESSSTGTGRTLSGRARPTGGSPCPPARSTLKTCFPSCASRSSRPHFPRRSTSMTTPAMMRASGHHCRRRGQTCGIMPRFDNRKSTPTTIRISPPKLDRMACSSFQLSTRKRSSRYGLHVFPTSGPRLHHSPCIYQSAFSTSEASGPAPHTRFGVLRSLPVSP